MRTNPREVTGPRVTDGPVRERGVAVVVRGDAVLMVRHDHPAHSIWTLPGGGVEPGESHEQTAARELLEETHLVARSLTFLTTAPVHGQLDHYYFVEVDPLAEPACGVDPELAGRRQVLQDVQWTPIASLADDCQMRIVAPLIRNGFGAGRP